MRRSSVFAIGVALTAAASAFSVIPDGRAQASGNWVCGAYDQSAKRNRNPTPDATGRVYPLVTIHGITGSDDDFDKTVDKSMIGANPQPPRTLLDAFAGPKTGGAVPPGLNHMRVYSFSYTPDSLRWIDNPALGPTFAQTIDCLYKLHDAPVSVVAHSMGGLVTRWVANTTDDQGTRRATKLGKVVTLGTPYQGSFLSSLANGATDVLGMRSPAIAILNYICGQEGTATGVGSCGPIPFYASFRSEAGRNLRVGATALTSMQTWPDGVDVTTIAGAEQIPFSLVGSPLNTAVDIGDLVVGTHSATADPTAGRVFECRYDTAAGTLGAALRRLLLIEDSWERHRRLTEAFTKSPCFHSALMRNVELTNEILRALSNWTSAQGTVTSEQLRGARVPPVCEDVAGTLVGGELRDASGSWLTIRAGGGVSDYPDGGSVALGDLDGDGIGDGAIVLSCWGSYGNSNSYAVVAYSGGLTLLGTVPNDDPQHGIWAQVVTKIKIEDGGVLEVQSHRYEADDSHGGPSNFVIQRFRYNGSGGFSLISSQQSLEFAGDYE